MSCKEYNGLSVELLEVELFSDTRINHFKELIVKVLMCEGACL